MDEEYDTRDVYFNVKKIRRYDDGQQLYLYLNINEESLCLVLNGYVFPLSVKHVHYVRRISQFLSRENSHSGLITPKIRSMAFVEEVDELSLLTGFCWGVR